MIGTMFDAHLKPAMNDFPCAVDDCEGCEGVSGPWKCVCECHDLPEEVELRLVEEAAA
jgi:hypothetical protein